MTAGTSHLMEPAVDHRADRFASTSDGTAAHAVDASAAVRPTHEQLAKELRAMREEKRRLQRRITHLQAERRTLCEALCKTW